MNNRSGKTTTSILALVVAIIALGVAAFAVYQRDVAPNYAGVAEQDKLFRRMTGVDSQQSTNSLDDRFMDGDGDMVADAPTDASKLIDPPTLTFSYITVEDDTTFRDAFKGLMDAISKATGKPVQYLSFDSVDAKLHAIRDGRLHVSGLITGAVPIGVCTAGFVPVCQLGDAGGSAGYHMQVIAPAGSDLTKLADLKGHTLTLTEPNSNSGYKAPLVILRENGLKPPTDYQITYSQGQTQSIAGIKAKRFQAAAVAGDVLKREENLGHIAAGDYKTIYTSTDSFPGAAIGYGNTLKPELAAKIKAAIMAYDFKGTGLEKEFAAEGKVKFVPADYKKDWAFVRRIDESVGFQYVLKDAPASQPATQPAAE